MIPVPVGAILLSLSLLAGAPAVRTSLPPTTTAPANSSCPQWYGLVMDAGWPADEWPTIDRVMWCESRCEPTAHNRSGATGLMQVMPMHAHGADLTDPATNLTVALDVWRRQGWRAWSCY